MTTAEVSIWQPLPAIPSAGLAADIRACIAYRALPFWRRWITRPPRGWRHPDQPYALRSIR